MLFLGLVLAAATALLCYAGYVFLIVDKREAAKEMEEPELFEELDMKEYFFELPEAVDRHPSAGRQALSALKRACRDQAPRMQIVAHAQLFELLNDFLSRSHTLAPLLYKTLIFSLIEHHQSEFVRQFVSNNMMQLMRRHQDLPVGVLVEPLLRQVGLHGYNNLDFDFFVFLARHSRLELRHVLQLLDLVHGLAVVDALHGRLASVRARPAVLSCLPICLPVHSWARFPAGANRLCSRSAEAGACADPLPRDS